MNYYLHNVGYDKPIDFRRMVLQAYKNRCVWLRDFQIDRLGLYDYAKWLPNPAYEQSNLDNAKKAYKKIKTELASISKEKLQKLYAEELCKYEVLHNSENSYYAEMASKAKHCAEKYHVYLNKWLEIPDTPNWLNEELIDIYDTAIKDAKENEVENAKAVKRMHSKVPPTFEEFSEQELQRIESNISFYADKIKSTKRAIKENEKQCEEVKQIFAWLDQIDGGKRNETLD
jgi:hypothetical protein